MPPSRPTKPCVLKRCLVAEFSVFAFFRAGFKHSGGLPMPFVSPNVCLVSRASLARASLGHFLAQCGLVFVKPFISYYGIPR